ncbi:MAG TPA: hypothetical protein PKU97_21605, partial [Kofleriaceae bacterium]|nr:hypothetical protein [Kofleriaceae bacterium]
MSLTPSQRVVIEREVRSLLEGSRAFGALPAEERARIFASTSEVAGKLVDQQLGAPARPAPKTRSRSTSCTS